MKKMKSEVFAAKKKYQNVPAYLAWYNGEGDLPGITGSPPLPP
jgi:hypothetical protein